MENFHGIQLFGKEEHFEYSDKNYVDVLAKSTIFLRKPVNTPFNKTVPEISIPILPHHTYKLKGTCELQETFNCKLFSMLLVNKYHKDLMIFFDNSSLKLVFSCLEKNVRLRNTECVNNLHRALPYKAKYPG